MISQFSEQVRKGIREQMNDLADYLAGGGATSYDQYANTTGEIRGLAKAERMLLDLTEAYEKGTGQ